MRRRTPRWLIAFFAVWPAFLLLWLVVGSCADRAAFRATQIQISLLASDANAVEGCPQLIEYSKRRPVVRDSLCVSGYYTLILQLDDRPNEQLWARMSGPLPSCFFPIIWSERFVTVSSIKLDVHDTSVTCYEHGSAGR